jgi:hypothetical protein
VKGSRKNVVGTNRDGGVLTAAVRRRIVAVVDARGVAIIRL